MDTLNHTQEEQIQEIVHEIETLAEELGRRARAGRSSDALEPYSARLHHYGEELLRIAAIRGGSRAHPNTEER